MKQRLGYEICFVIAALWALPQAAKAAGIATVMDVVNEGYRTPPGAEEITARSADELVQDEALRTEKESTIQVQFVDGSELSVEQSSEMVLSDYVFDGAASTGLIDLNSGLFHFTSNGKPDQGVKLRTPVATIGVRGTEFLVHVDRDEATIIDILDGSVEATPNGGGKPITCVGGQSILIASADDDAQCGDIGSFSTAAGPGTGGSDTNPQPGHVGQDGAKNAVGGRHEPPKSPGGITGGGGDGGGQGGGQGEGGQGEGGQGEGGQGEGGQGEGGQGEGGQGEGGQGEGGQGEGGQGEGGQGEGGQGEGGQGEGGQGEGGQGGSN